MILNCYCYNDLISFPVGKRHARQGTSAPRKRDTGRAFWFPATLAPISSVLSPLPPVAWGGQFSLPLKAHTESPPPIVRQRSASVRTSGAAREDRACSKSSESRRMKTKSDVRVSGGMNSLRFIRYMRAKIQNFLELLTNSPHLFNNIKTKCGRGRCLFNAFIAF